MSNEYIIKRPIITEKSIRDAQKGVFTFEVDKRATKPEAGNAINKMFNVHVKAITSTIVKGKKRLAGRKRTAVYQPDTKKVRVKLAANEKIDLFEVGKGK
jgi:large subunit ribosomal protein L23